MTALQEELKKLLNESDTLDGNDALKEASFEDIAKAAGEINPQKLNNTVARPAAKFAENCANAGQAIQIALNALKTVDSVYKFNKNSAYPPNRKDGMFTGLKRKLGDTKDKNENKQNVLNQLKNASRMMSQAQNELAEAKSYFTQLNKELKKLYNAVESIQKLVDSKSSFFGRMFGFWK